MLESTQCDGSLQSVVESRSCTLAYTHLRDTEYTLELSDSILFQVRAQNVKGWGPYSSYNTVIDVVRTEPLAPLTQVTEGALTDDS